MKDFNFLAYPHTNFRDPNRKVVPACRDVCAAQAGLPSGMATSYGARSGCVNVKYPRVASVAFD